MVNILIPAPPLLQRAIRLNRSYSIQGFLENSFKHKNPTNCKTAHNKPTANTGKTNRGTTRLALRDPPTQLPKNVWPFPLGGSSETRGTAFKVFPLFGLGKGESWPWLSLWERRGVFWLKRRTLHPDIWIVPLSHVSWVATNTLHQFPAVLPSHIPSPK